MEIYGVVVQLLMLPARYSGTQQQCQQAIGPNQTNPRHINMPSSKLLNEARSAMTYATESEMAHATIC